MFKRVFSTLQYLRWHSTAAAPVPLADLTHFTEFVEGTRNLLVLTGAGISTASGIPDYRSPNGAYSQGYKPLIHGDFVRHHKTRQRYWARSMVAWRKVGPAINPEMAASEPNPAHRSLAAMESFFPVNIITQNVDGLHQKAGQSSAFIPGSDPLELHGGLARVICLSCSAVFDRNQFQDRLIELNPSWIEQDSPSGERQLVGAVRPDGDVELKNGTEHFHVPGCPLCGGILKPDVVFFGGTVPATVHSRADALLASADRLLLVGTTVHTYSAFRLVRAAAQRSMPIASVCLGKTRADDLFRYNFQHNVVDFLSTFVQRRNEIHDSKIADQLRR